MSEDNILNKDVRIQILKAQREQLLTITEVHSDLDPEQFEGFLQETTASINAELDQLTNG